jgi:hypothetical protein
MTYIPPTVAYVDRLGHVWCPEHRPERPAEPVDGGNSAVEGQACEGCGTVIHTVPTRDYVRGN